MDFILKIKVYYLIVRIVKNTVRFYWTFYVHVHFPNIRDFIDKGLAEVCTSEKLLLDQDFLFVLVVFAVASIFSYSTTITIASSHFLTFSIFLNANHHYDKPKSNNYVLFWLQVRNLGKMTKKKLRKKEVQDELTISLFDEKDEPENKELSKKLRMSESVKMRLLQSMKKY